MRALLTALLFAISALPQTIPPEEAESAFALAHRISAEDEGRTWGVELCGPMLFADAATHEAVANQADGQGELARSGVEWTGKLPESVSIANTAIEWAGVRWTMIGWPLPADTRARAQLLAHECFHRIQPAIHLPAADPLSAHLDGRDGRIWLLLEWRALEKALVVRGAARRSAIADALAFRDHRRELFRDAAQTENRLEMNEGLAEYTGVRLANPDIASPEAAAIFMLRDGARRSSFVRSFAYASGPAYGVLIDESGIEWRKALTPSSDLGKILANAYRVKPGVVSASAKYGGDEIVAYETLRAHTLEKQISELRRRFVEGPVLVLPAMNDFSYGFNPSALVPLDANSAIYRSLRVTDSWGVLEAPEGGLVIRENGTIKRVAVPAPSSISTSPVEGDGWKLQLKPGFRIASGARSGDYEVTR